MKVLYCDDDTRMLEMVGEFFKLAGHTIELADSAFGLSRRIVQFQPDVLLLDYRMPGLSGDNFLGVFSHTAQARRTRIYFYSAEDEVRLADMVRRTGAHGYISKATAGSMLVRRVESLVNEEVKAVLL